MLIEQIEVAVAELDAQLEGALEPFRDARSSGSR
jgi:hypothetical protein